MIDDAFENTANSLSAPAAECFALAADDSADLARATKAIYVGTGGDIRLRALHSDIDVTLTGVPSGSILPIRVRALRVSGTTASNIVGLS
ncbi:MAG: hypothetical protein V2J14_11880 [Erythrobacter sp.]|jgi:hypothetical protein|nr:hypothetical protein [Erythrobacter sp.]